MKKSQFQTPVLFLIYNRPEESERVMKQIRKVKPKYLYIAGDGAKNNPNDILGVHITRNNVLYLIDWDCEIKTLFRKENLGCKYAVSEAIDWFFNNVEQGIILEDDTLPDKSFFYFCEEMLKKYKNNKNIFHISGTNVDGHSKKPYTYFYSKTSNVWGWATWRDRWEKYDVEMRDYPQYKKYIFMNRLKKQGLLPTLRGKYIYDKTFTGEKDTWDYQWGYTIEKNDGFSIIPTYNLIKNIGFERATHTTGDDKSIPLYSVQKPYFEVYDKHKESCLQEYDKRFMKFFQGNLYKKAIKKLINPK